MDDIRKGKESRWLRRHLHGWLKKGFLLTTITINSAKFALSPLSKNSLPPPKMQFAYYTITRKKRGEGGLLRVCTQITRPLPHLPCPLEATHCVLYTQNFAVCNGKIAMLCCERCSQNYADLFLSLTFFLCIPFWVLNVFRFNLLITPNWIFMFNKWFIFKVFLRKRKSTMFRKKKNFLKGMEIFLVYRITLRWMGGAKWRCLLRKKGASMENG